MIKAFKLIAYIFCGILVLLSIYPIFSKSLDLWNHHDGAAHITRSYLLIEMLRSGNWYPRWFPEQYGGYGYPTLLFYAPLVYYLTFLVSELTNKYIHIYDSYRILLFFSSISVMTSVIIFGKVLFNSWLIGLLMSGMVMYGPYVIQTNIFVSASAPHVLGISMMGWFILSWFIFYTTTIQRKYSIIICITCTLLLMLSHGISVIMSVIFLVFWIPGFLILYRKNIIQNTIMIVMSSSIGILISAFFWVPSVFETNLVQTDRLQLGAVNFHNWFIVWPGYHPPLWGLNDNKFTKGFPFHLGFTYSNTIEGPLRLSLWQFLVFTASFILFLYQNLKQNTRISKKQKYFLSIAAISSFIGIVVYSQQFDWMIVYWEKFPILQKIQMPTRMYGIIAYTSSIALGAILSIYSLRRLFLYPIVIILLIIFSLSGVINRKIIISDNIQKEIDYERIDSTESKDPGSTASTNEFLPRTARYETYLGNEARGFWLYDRMYPEAGWVAGQVMGWGDVVAVHEVAQAGLSWVADVTVGVGGAELAVHQLYFPGWRAWVDGRPTAMRPAPWIEAQLFQPGFILIDVPEGRHRVTLRYGADVAQLAGAGISAATALGLACWVAWRWRASGAWVRAGAWGVAGLLVVVSVVGVGRLVVGTRAPDSRLGSVVGPVPRSLVVRSVADGVEDGTVRVASPTGGVLGRGQYVDVRGMAVQAQDRPLRDAGPVWRRAVYAHPPTELAFEMDVPETVGGRAAYFQAGLAVDPGVWEATLGDGVRFGVRVREPGGEWERVVDEVVNPRANGDQRRWNDVVVPLGRWAGRRVEVAMVTDARGEPSNDWAVWGEPTVVMLDVLGAGRLTRSAAWIAKVALGRVG